MVLEVRDRFRSAVQEVEDQEDEHLDWIDMLEKFYGPFKDSLEHAMENLVSQSTNEAELWLSEEVPFGIARWNVKVRRLAKDKAAPRPLSGRPTTARCHDREWKTRR